MKFLLLHRSTLVTALAGALLAAAIATPGIGQAQSWLSVFQPKHFVAVDVRPTDERGIEALPNLEAYGTIRGTRVPAVNELDSLAEVRSATGLPLRAPADIPTDVRTDVHYSATSSAQSTFTFSAAKTRATARRQNASVPPLPARLDGTQVRVSVPPIAIVRYGAMPAREHRAARRHIRPMLVVAETRVPTVRTHGASLEELERYLLAQPGISPQLAAQIRAIGSGDTLPVPIRVDRQTAHNVTVNGVEGLAIGDNTGIGAGVIWQKAGVLYAVAGTYPEDRVLAIAATLQ